MHVRGGVELAAQVVPARPHVGDHAGERVEWDSTRCDLVVREITRQADRLEAQPAARRAESACAAARLPVDQLRERRDHDLGVVARRAGSTGRRTRGRVAARIRPSRVDGCRRARASTRSVRTELCRRAHAQIVGLDHLELEQAREEDREHEHDERGDPRHALLDVGVAAAADALVEARSRDPAPRGDPQRAAPDLFTDTHATSPTRPRRPRAQRAR
jgi:hypothetical protein